MYFCYSVQFTDMYLLVVCMLHRARCIAFVHDALTTNSVIWKYPTARSPRWMHMKIEAGQRYRACTVKEHNFTFASYSSRCFTRNSWLVKFYWPPFIMATIQDSVISRMLHARVRVLNYMSLDEWLIFLWGLWSR